MVALITHLFYKENITKIERKWQKNNNLESNDGNLKTHQLKGESVLDHSLVLTNALSPF